jgi:hypothetical protein
LRDSNAEAEAEVEVEVELLMFDDALLLLLLLSDMYLAASRNVASYVAARRRRSRIALSDTYNAAGEADNATDSVGNTSRALSDELLLIDDLVFVSLGINAIDNDTGVGDNTALECNNANVAPDNNGESLSTGYAQGNAGGRCGTLTWVSRAAAGGGRK